MIDAGLAVFCINHVLLGLKLNTWFIDLGITMEPDNNFWILLRDRHGIVLRPDIQKILTLGGYANPISFSCITEERLLELEKYHQQARKFSYLFSPGEKDFIIKISKLIYLDLKPFNL